MRGHPRDARIHHDELASALHEVDERVAEEAVGVGEQRVLAPQHDVLRHFVARVVEAVGDVGGVVEFGVAGAQDEVGHRAARAVAAVARHGEARVRRAERRIGERRLVERRLAPGALEGHDGLGPVVLLDVVHAFFYDVERLVPRDFDPGVLAAVLRVALQGVQHALLVVHVFRKRQAAHAQASLCDGDGPRRPPRPPPCRPSRSGTCRTRRDGRPGATRHRYGT